jgi:hypothetical protein
MSRLWSLEESMTQMSAGRRQRRRLAQMFQEAFAPRIAPERQGEALQALLTQFDGESIGAITRAEFLIRCKHTMRPFLEEPTLPPDHPVMEMKRAFDEVLGGADGREHGTNGLRIVSGGAAAGEHDAVDDSGRVADLVDVCTLTEEEEAGALRLALARLDDAETHLRIATEAQQEPKDPFFTDALEMLNGARYDLRRLLGIHG